MPVAQWLTKNLKIEINKSISPLALFLIKAGAIYAFWQLFYDLVLLPDARLDTFLSLTGINMAGGLLSLLGWDVDVSGRVLTCVGNRGIEIQNGCNGLNLLGVYGGFIFAYPGDWKKRLIFLSTGLLVLFFANILRIAFFAVFNANIPQYWDVAHDYSSYIFFYPIVLSFWYLWTVISDQKHTLISG